MTKKTELQQSAIDLAMTIKTRVVNLPIKSKEEQNKLETLKANAIAALLDEALD